MEFLKGLKQALDTGLSKEEFINKYTQEMNFRLEVAQTDSSQVVDQTDQKDKQDAVSFTQDMGVMTDNVGEADDKGSLKTALTEMAGQLKQMAFQQEELQTQIKTFQESNQQLKHHLQNAQQQQTKRQDILTEKLDQIETTISDMENSVSKSVQKCFEKVGLSLKEQLSLTVETHHNHTRDQLQKLRAAIVNEICEKMMQFVEKTFEEKAKQIAAESLASVKEQIVDDEEEESSDEYCSAENDNDSDDEDSYSLETKGNKSVENSGTNTEENSSIHTVASSDRVIKNIKSAMTDDRTEIKKTKACDSIQEKTNQDTSLPSKFPRRIKSWKRSTKAALHKELNTFMVDIQKLILKPLTSDDLVHQFVASVGGLLNSERNCLSDLLQEVQTAIGSEIQARFYKLEQSVKHEILQAVQDIPQSEVQDRFNLYRPAAQLYSSQTSLASFDTESEITPFLAKQIPIAHKQLWFLKPVSSLLKGNATESKEIVDHTRGYRFELLAEFQVYNLDMSIAPMCGGNDANLTWPVYVKVTLTFQHQKEKHRNFSVSKVRSIKKPAGNQDGRSLASLLRLFEWKYLDKFVHEDSLLLRFSLSIAHQK